MRRCPDCRNPFLEVLAERDLGACARWVSCPSCGTDGPVSTSTAAAMGAWDAWVDSSPQPSLAPETARRDRA